MDFYHKLYLEIKILKDRITELEDGEKAYVFGVPAQSAYPFQDLAIEELKARIVALENLHTPDSFGDQPRMTIAVIEDYRICRHSLEQLKNVLIFKNAEIKRLRELVAAYDKYGQHLYSCSARSKKEHQMNYACTCGFDQVRKAFSKG